MEGIFWLAVIIIMALIELFTLGLTSIWFAGGALIAFIASLLGAGLSLQIILFVVVSLVLLLFTRPFAAKYINTGRTKTNAESLIGTTAVVLEEINNEKAQGHVSVNGLEWTARSYDETIITQDSVVEIMEIRGVKLMVKKSKTNDKEKYAEEIK
ncbi:MAG: NfeD family protein [Lachnospiraceae bacterium]